MRRFGGEEEVQINPAVALVEFIDLGLPGLIHPVICEE